MTGRVPPEGDAEALRRYLRMNEDEVKRRLDRLDSRTPERRELSIRSLGPGEEIREPHSFPRPPTRFQEICPRGDDRVFQSREDLADAEFAYFKSTGSEGTRHTVEIWRA